jgi:hypothetical protein
MDASAIRAIHRYGAVCSVVAIALAVVAFAVRGPDSFLGLIFGFAGPLCGFYFVGAVLQGTTEYSDLGEELMRGVVWYGASLFGWSFIVTSSDALSATPFTAVGLPALTALGLTLATVAVRRVTGLDLTVQTEGGQLLVAITGTVVGGFVVLYLVLVNGESLLLVPAYALATAVGLLDSRRHWGRERPA